MADYTITRYLKLKIADDLSADAKYNLLRIDALGSTFINDINETLNVRSATDIKIEPQAAAVGGTGVGGQLIIGGPSHFIDTVAYTNSFVLSSALTLPAGPTTYLSLRGNSNAANSSVLFLDAAGGFRSLTVDVDGTAVVKDGVQTLTNKTISGLNNTFQSIPNSATTATSANTAGAIVTRDGSGNFSAGTITASLSGNATTATATAGLTGSNLSGDVSNVGNAITVTSVGGQSSASVAAGVYLANNATQFNVANSIVLRDANKGFSAENVNVNGLLTAGAVSADILSGALAASNLTGTVTVAKGGTGAGTAAQARTNLGAAASGANSDITSLTGLTTPLSIAQGGTGSATVAANIVFAAPNGVTGAPSFRALVAADIPNIDASKITSGILALAQGGTGASTATQARTNLGVTAANILPSYTGNALATLRVNSSATDIEWAIGAGQGTVTGVTATSPLQITGDYQVNPNVTLPQATSLVSGYLTSTDWSTFNGKVNAAGAKAASVTSNINNVDQTLAPDCTAVKGYVTAIAGGAVSYTWSTANGATKNINHALNKNTVSVTIYDENGEDILVDVIDRVDVDNITLTASVAPTGNWTVIIRP